MIVEKTVVERPLVEGKLFDRSENGKMVRGLAVKTMLIKIGRFDSGVEDLW